MAEETVLDKYKEMPGVLGLDVKRYRDAVSALQRRIDGSEGSLPVRSMNDYGALLEELEVANYARHMLYQIAREYSPADAANPTKPPLDGLETLARQIGFARKFSGDKDRSESFVADDEPDDGSIFRESIFSGVADASLSRLLELVTLSDDQYLIYQRVRGYTQAYTHAKAFIHAIDVAYRGLIVQNTDSTAVPRDKTFHFSTS